MSITLYACSDCKRNIELVDNSDAITFVNSCIITQYCKGTLSKVQTRPGSFVGNTVDMVDGLQDYSKTGRMYSYTQQLASSSWKINHNLNSNPITYVYIKTVNNTYTPIDDDDYVVNVIDPNNIVIEFAEKIVGIAHIISSGNVQQIEQSTQIESIQASANSILTIATPVIQDDQSILSYDVGFISPSTTIERIVNIQFTAHNYNQSIALFNTPWRDVQLITYKDTLYRVRSVRITNVINANGIQDGSPFYFVDNPNIIMLISNYPYNDMVDIDTRVVQVNQLNDEYFKLSDSEVVVLTSQISDHFPQTKVYKTIYQ